MKTSFLFPISIFSLLIGLSACSNPIKDKGKLKEDPASDNAAQNIIQVQQANTNTVVMAEEDIVGFWVGWFQPAKEVVDTNDNSGWDHSNKITLSIDSIGGGKVAGHSIVAGNLRPFRGNYEADHEGYRFDVVEPGDDKYDGVFTFTILHGDSVINGKWTAYQDIKVKDRTYELSKRSFKYDPKQRMENRYVDMNKTKQSGDYSVGENGEVYYDVHYFMTTSAIFKYNPSVMALDKHKVEKLSKGDLFILRNSIYAKHGYSFKNRQLRVYFDEQDWYMPVFVDIKNELSQTERDNIKLLMQYEKHAEEYYDEFGR